MKVFCYYQRIPGMDPEWELLDLWKRSWERNGWTPVTLSERDARKANGKLAQYIIDSPELNRGNLPEGYATSCHLRWLAHPGGLHVDVDLINRNFTPVDMDNILEAIGVGQPISLGGNHCPCAVYTGPKQALKMLATIVTHAACVDSGLLSVEDLGGELATVAHDQAIFAGRDLFTIPPTPLMAEYNQHGWQAAPLVHFNNGNVPADRAGVVRASGVL